MGSRKTKHERATYENRTKDMDPRLSRRFADTIERAYSTCSWMTDDAFQYAIGDAVDTFLGEAPAADIY